MEVPTCSFMLPLGIIVHDLPRREHILNIPSAHKGKVSGLTFAGPDRLLSCGVDRNVKLWQTEHAYDGNGVAESEAGPSTVSLAASLGSHRSAQLSS